MEKVRLKKAKDAIKYGEEYLAANDLYGFYESVNDKFSADDIGAVTYILDKCGIDLYGEVAKMGSVPDRFCSNAPIPKGFLNGDTLSFPTTVRYIGYMSFSFDETFSHLILDSPIAFLGIGAFFSCAIEKLTLGEQTVNTLIRGGSELVDSVFSYNNNCLKEIYIPKKCFDDDNTSSEVLSIFENSQYHVVNDDLSLSAI